jgi:hypothetical protein
VLLAFALVLAGVQVLVGRPARALPDLPLLAVLSLVPLALTTRVVHAPGVASAVCGAYLLPRALASLLQPQLGFPPLLLVAAFGFDVCMWLRASDLRAVATAWPGRHAVWRRRTRTIRHFGWARAALAGGVFGALAVLFEPSLSVDADFGLALVIGSVGCAMASSAILGWR